jgi:hypothetical protein
MKKKLFLTIIMLFICRVFFAQTKPENAIYPGSNKGDAGSENLHELTIYFIPSKAYYDWSSPHTLYRSYVKNYLRNLLKKDRYCYPLGHAFLELRSPLVPGKLLAGIRSTSREEQADYVMKDHYGLAILGTDLQGKLESPDDLEDVKEKYTQKGKLAFLRLLISEEQASLMINFYEAFKVRIDSMGSPGRFYGGAFWPRYYGEGSGCSAFVVSFLDIPGILREEYDEWIVDINIPMNLIGGPFNQFHEVEMKEIKKCRSWADDLSVAHVDYEPFKIYDPSLMYDWVIKMHDRQDSLPELVSLVSLNKSKGVEIDARSFPIPKNESIFLYRTEPSIFIDKIHERTAVGN